MMFEMRLRKPKSTRVPTQGIFNCSHNIGMVWVELDFDDAVSYTQLWGSGLQHIPVTYGSDRIHIHVTRVTNPVP